MRGIKQRLIIEKLNLEHDLRGKRLYTCEKLQHLGKSVNQSWKHYFQAG